LREWVIQRGRFGPGAWDYLRAGGTGQQRRVSSSVGAAALGASESASALGAIAFAATGASEYTASADALHTFTLDSGASRCFFRDCTTVTPLAAPVPVSLADPSGGPVVARASTVLPCPAVPSGSLSGLHLPSFSTNLVSNAVLQDVWVDTFPLEGSVWRSSPAAFVAQGCVVPWLSRVSSRVTPSLAAVERCPMLSCRDGVGAAGPGVASGCLCAWLTVRWRDSHFVVSVVISSALSCSCRVSYSGLGFESQCVHFGHPSVCTSGISVRGGVRGPLVIPD
ncbi:unnamed protein product, partial [Closterium sp. NIES-54]